MSKDIFVIVEQRNGVVQKVTKELIGESVKLAGDLGEEVVAVLMGYNIKGEFSANGVDNSLSHERGVISMARAMAYDSAGSQFFICHADSQFLDGQYAAFGKVIEGMDVVDAIASVKTNSQDKPLQDQVIDSIRVDTFGVEYGEPEKL